MLADSFLSVIIKITEEKAETLQQLTKLKLKPGERVQIENVVPRECVTIRVRNESYTIDHTMASIIYVKKSEVDVRN